MKQYKTLQTGMSYDSVTKVVGCDGVELSSSEMAGFKTVMYIWSGVNFSSMSVMLQNDKLITKSQFGLK